LARTGNICHSQCQRKVVPCKQLKRCGGRKENNKYERDPQGNKGIYNSFGSIAPKKLAYAAEGIKPVKSKCLQGDHAA
jgi:hypothetical protein